MYKSFAIITVLIALAVGAFAGNLPTGGADNATNASEEAASNMVEQAAAPQAAPMPRPSQTPPADPSAPLASASAPTLVLDSYTTPPEQKAPTQPAAQPTTPRTAPEINPIPTGDKFPPGKILTSTFQADSRK
ncbi:hypothetical protein [Sphingobium phenoxybenzoativorans]|uniref:hypothetical protein n=1 Tax=Sphingobium phenoxybenzoativorans TaxID=1592790 RepID=UPI0008725A55|nr:hypothetical protein [Sphingobium phenoxybenzoativorans]